MALPATATDLDGWRIVQISVSDQVAVAKSPDGELQLVRVGDRLGERTVVTGFEGGRLVLEQPGQWGRAALFVSLLDGCPRIERMERQPLRKNEFTGGRVAIVAQ